jgi:hypothetical protein
MKLSPADIGPLVVDHSLRSPTTVALFEATSGLNSALEDARRSLHSRTGLVNT